MRSPPIGVSRSPGQRRGGYLYYIKNPEAIDEHLLQKWMLDTFAVGDIIRGNLSLRDCILVESVPSGHIYLTDILEAMREGRTLKITYRSFRKSKSDRFPVEPYCVKLFEGRWYVVAYNPPYKGIRTFALDRIEAVEQTEDRYTLPADFSASEYFAGYYGINTDGHKRAPERVVVRAHRPHKHYMMTLPEYHSQRLIVDTEGYADFEFFLVPTYDFVMHLLRAGSMIEVLSPASLRQEMKAWAQALYRLYEDD